MANPLCPDFLELILNHVALPKKLPGVSDTELHRIDAALIFRLEYATRELIALQPLQTQNWDCLRRSLQACRLINVDGRIDCDSLRREFKALQPDEFLILHVVEQNAGLLIYQQKQ